MELSLKKRELENTEKESTIVKKIKIKDELEIELLEEKVIEVKPTTPLLTVEKKKILPLEEEQQMILVRKIIIEIIREMKLYFRLDNSRERKGNIWKFQPKKEEPFSYYHFFMYNNDPKKHFKYEELIPIYTMFVNKLQDKFSKVDLHFDQIFFLKRSDKNLNEFHLYMRRPFLTN